MMVKIEQNVAHANFLIVGHGEGLAALMGRITKDGANTGTSSTAPTTQNTSSISWTTARNCVASAVVNCRIS